jgi:Tfp pilus assembly protein PilO
MQIKNRQQLLVIVAGTVIGLFVADKIVIGPVWSLWKARSEQIAKLRKQVDDGNHLIKRESSLNARWEQMRTNTLPTNESQAEQLVLKAVDRWSQKSGVSITSISPQWKHDADEYMTLQCRVDATGNMGTLKNFLYSIEKDPLALKLEMVEISTRDPEGQLLNLGLQISGLVLTPQTAKKL